MGLKLVLFERCVEREEEMNRRKVLLRGMKVGVLLCAVFLLTACSNTMEGSFEKESAKKFNAYGVTCYAPEEWAVKKSKCSAEFKSKDSFAGYEVSFEGKCDEQQADMIVRELIQALEYYDEESLETISVDGCSAAYAVQGKVTSDSEPTEIWYDRFVFCKGALIKFHGRASENYFDKDEFDKIYNACDFSDCEELIVESISAEYDGSGYAGALQEYDISVTAHYNNGADTRVTDWTTDDSLLLIPYHTSIIKIEYENREYDLEVECTECKGLDDYESVPNFWYFDGEVRYDKEQSQLLLYALSGTGASDAYYYTIPKKEMVQAVKNYVKMLKENGYKKVSEDGNMANYLNREEGLGITISYGDNTKNTELGTVTIIIIEI